ncbi:tyrosine-protein kinase receptor TYRO3 isoform X3 [Siniperca chuatsi]|uniref:tyrosine-protein kinase receptor TYRO3 isoform X3 n=1 Tax=Siniperca chuatsi TaxID=119488 RepID=UPI001CE14BA7|nr:tyrosine-protein kinase receptor TYRO3 isoform X3 [Siniperca chuatsi]
MKPVLWILLFFLRSHEGTCGAGVLFTKHPSNQTVSQGNAARLGCAVQGLTEPDIVWMKDGEKLYSTDQMFITLGEQHWETYHSVKSVQQQDAGQYWCEVEFHGLTFSSERAWITVEGVPHFVQEPQDVATLPNVPFNLTCAAVGPPEPVEVLWWLGGVQEGQPRPSPSVLHVQGANGSVKFYCEAKNARGISVSRTGTVHIKVLPAAPVGLQVLRMVDNNVTLSWKPGFTGHSELSTCIVQLSRRSVRRWDLPQQEVLVPPHLQVLSGLRSHSNYSVRVSCVNEVGASPFCPWLHFQTPESVDSLGINDDLKNKLQDVLIPERLLTLGHMLGKGEFGSVREALLKTEDSSVQKVAVKVLKSDITSTGDIEQCLKEAAYMKDFHHPNVIQLIGVSLHRRPGQRLPIPMVILPFMKHGDLHTFLLLSRLGEHPFDQSLQTLLQFMLDISRGMEYLSSRNIIHRDLAARNCMLNENMTVCVADFGLSKKIYSGDYYRQGSVSKLPVKWIALESLADNVYTTQSDVWAFGVTMWEIMTRGQTPYPGVENSEIYEYLIKGERLKKPPDCRDDIYEIMHSCWSPVPKCRPSFQHLVVQLEALRLGLSPAPPPTEPLLYVNLDGDEGEPGRGGAAGVGAPGPREATAAGAPSWSVPWQRRADGDEDWLIVGSGAALAIGGDYRYIIGPCGPPEDDGGEGEGGERRRGESMDTLQEEVRDEEDDVIINV